MHKAAKTNEWTGHMVADIDNDMSNDSNNRIESNYHKIFKTLHRNAVQHVSVLTSIRHNPSRFKRSLPHPTAGVIY